MTAWHWGEGVECPTALIPQFPCLREKQTKLQFCGRHLSSLYSEDASGYTWQRILPSVQSQKCLCTKVTERSDRQKSRTHLFKYTIDEGNSSKLDSVFHNSSPTPYSLLVRLCRKGAIEHSETGSDCAETPGQDKLGTQINQEMTARQAPHPLAPSMLETWNARQPLLGIRALASIFTQGLCLESSAMNPFTSKTRIKTE